MLHLHFQGYCFQGKLLLPEYLCKSQVNNSLINRSKFVYFGMVFLQKFFLTLLMNGDTDINHNAMRNVFRGTTYV